MKPMLAGKCPSFDLVKYPVLATPKIDGIRCLVKDSQVLSRSLKYIPNRHIRDTIRQISCLGYFDGEIICPGKSFNETSAAIRSYDGEPRFKYLIFDLIEPYPYQQRMEILSNIELPYFCDKLLPIVIWNEDELRFYEDKCVQDNFEGAMIRSIDGPYKYGRSTTKEGYLLKIKRFEDSDAIVIGFEELMHNDNIAFISELNYTKRSTHIENQVPMDKLGALIVVNEAGVEFKIGTGFTDYDRRYIWKSKESFIGMKVKYKHQPHGAKDAPRSPVFLGFRD